MKVLIAHHLETMWDEGLKLFGGTTFEREAERVREHLEENEYDRVILTRFEDAELEPQHYEAGLASHIDEVYDYAYGWEEGEIDGEEGVDWAEGGSHSGVVMLTNWLHQLKEWGAHVDLCGAFDGECIEDMEIALRAIGIPFTRLESLIT